MVPAEYQGVRLPGHCIFCGHGARFCCCDCELPVCSDKKCSTPHKRKKQGPGYYLSGTYRRCNPCEVKHE